MVTSNERIQNLAKYLGVDPETVKQSSYDSELFETDDGEEYLVLTEDEARERAADYIKETIDDMGLEAFTPNFQEWICENALDSDIFDEIFREDCETLANEFLDEDADDDKFMNHLVELAYEADIINDGNFVENEDGSINYGEIDEKVMSLVEIEEKYADYLYGQEDDPIEWFRNVFGDNEITHMVKNGKADLDIEKVVDECIEQDGIAHFISYYDSVEHDLGSALYAYRQA